jgi:hypothetical protein
MYRSVKISEKAYREAKRLAEEMNKGSGINGRKMGISNVVANGVALASDAYARKKRLMAAAGGWADMDPSIVDEIYKSRLVSTRPEIKL